LRKVLKKGLRDKKVDIPVHYSFSFSGFIKKIKVTINAVFLMPLISIYALCPLEFITTPHYMCVFPTNYEKKAGIIPDKILVTGAELITRTREFCSDLEVELAPAFRENDVWEEDFFIRAIDKNNLNLLVVLPYDLAVALEILELLDCAIQKMDENQRKMLKFNIKPHMDSSEKKNPFEF
jgi:hypothetical protein